MTKIKIHQGTAGAIALGSGEMQTLLRDEFVDVTMPFQRAYKPFKFMPLNDRKKHIRRRIKADGIFWQPYQACGIPNGGNVIIDGESIEPCAVSMGMELCSEMLGNCMQFIDSYDADGQVTTETFEQNFMPIIREHVSNLGAIQLAGLLLGGQFYSGLSGSGVAIDPAMGASAPLFAKQEAACKGLLQFLKENILKCNVIGDNDYTTCTNLPEILGLLDALRCCAQEKNPHLKRVVNFGYRATSGSGSPVILVSDNIYPRFTGAYHGQVALQSPEFSPLSRVQLADGQFSYMYHNMPILPIPIGMWDAYYKHADGSNINTQFIALTTSENIEFGLNYSEEAFMGTSEPVALKVTKDPDPRKKNTFVIDSTALVSVNVVNPDLLVYDLKV